MIDNKVANTTADLLCSTLKLEKINIVTGGPSISDPLGLISLYVAFRDKRNQGFWFGIDDNGVIQKFGATIDHKSYEFPTPITVEQL